VFASPHPTAWDEHVAVVEAATRAFADLRGKARAEAEEARQEREELRPAIAAEAEAAGLEWSTYSRLED
jgi:hypothetical protein